MAQAQQKPTTPTDEIQTPASRAPNSYGGASANPTAGGAGTAQGQGTGVLDMSFGVGYGGSADGPAFGLVRQSAGGTR